MTTPQQWLDNSKCNAIERCPREFMLRYLLHLNRSDEDTLVMDFGKAFHRGVETFFNAIFVDNQTESEALEKAVATATAELNSALQHLAEIGAESLYTDPRANPDLLIRALTYFLTAGAGLDILRMASTVMSEMKLRFPIPNSAMEFLARVDLLVHTHGGDWIVVDVKTTRWPVRDWPRKALVDTQITTYALAVRESGITDQVNAGAYAVCRADQRKLKSGAWSPNVSLESELIPVALTVSKLEAMKNRIVRIATHLQPIIGDGDPPSPLQFPCHWSACQRLRGICQFAQLCELTWDFADAESIREKAHEMGFVEDPWDPFAI